MISSSHTQSNPSYSSHASNTQGLEYETIPPRSTEDGVMEEYEAQSISVGQGEGAASSPKCNRNNYGFYSDLRTGCAVFSILRLNTNTVELKAHDMILLWTN